MKTYADVADYEKECKKIKEQIRKMREDKKHRFGGSLFDWKRYLEETERKKLFAQTQKLAKQQGKEDVVNRLIKVAEKHNRFAIYERKAILAYAAGGAYVGTMISIGGLYSAAPLVVAGGAVLAAVGTACLKKQGEKLNDIEKAHFILKKYAKTGDLEKAQQRASEVDKRMKKMMKARTDNAFKFKNPLKTRASR